MQSSGAMSGCGVGTSSEVLMHCSDEGAQSAVDQDEDSKMKSQRSNAGDHSSIILEEEPKNDFEKAIDVADQADAEAQQELEHSEEGALHTDAEDDLRMIQEQLRQFQDITISEYRESIIKDQLEASQSENNRLSQG